MIIKLLKKIIFVVLISIVPVSRAESALYIDDTSITDVGRFYAEFGFDYYKDIEKEYDPDSDEFTKTVSKETDISVSLCYGLTADWEVGISLPYIFIDDSSSSEADGLSDIAVETKYRFFHEQEFIPSYALYIGLKTDSANDDKGLGTGKKDYTLNNIFTKNAGDYVFDLNLGYIFIGGKSDDVFFYCLDISKELTDKISFCSELYGETTFGGNFDDNIFCCGFSLGYQLSEVICLESGLGVGISKSSPDYQVSTTLSFSF